MHLAPGNGRPKLEFASHHPPYHLSDLASFWLLDLHDRWLWKHHRAQWERLRSGGPRTVMVGRYGYDEHQGEEFRSGKMPKDCEFTLAAKDLGVAGHPALKALMDYIFKVDAAGQSKGILKFGRVVELLYGIYPSVEWWRVEQFAQLVIEASIRFGFATANGEEVKLPDQQSISKVIASAYAIVEREFSAEELTWIEPMVRQWVKGKLFFKPFGLPYCIRLLWWDFERLPRELRAENKRWIVEWAADAMRAELVRQRRHLAARHEFDKELESPQDTKTTELVFIHRGEEAVCFFVQSENPTYHNFVFSDTGSAIAVAIRRLSRHVQIFSRKHGGRTVSLQFTVALLRAKEQEKRGYPISRWQELIAPEGPKGAECWFYHPRIDCILNRHPEAEATLLGDGEIQECLVRGLSDEWAEFRKQFRRERESAATAVRV